MRRIEAVRILKEVQGNSYSYMEQWGLSLIKEARYTLENRILTENEAELLNEIREKLARRY